MAQTVRQSLTTATRRAVQGDGTKHTCGTLHVKQLRARGIYSLALTPYQYVAMPIEHPQALWVLVPEYADNPVIGGPPLYVTHDGILAIKDGPTELTTDSLDFTGRYRIA